MELVNLPLALINSFTVWHRPVYVYRLGREGQSMSVTGIRKHYKDHEKVFWKLLELYKRMPDAEPLKRKLLRNRLKKEIAAHFKYCCMLETSRTSYREIKSFGRKLEKEAPEIMAEARAYSRFVKMLSGTKYMLYPVASVYYGKKYSK